MKTAAAEENQSVQPMGAELAARVTAFARACKAAARNVALYPGEHPTVAAVLDAVTSAAADATSTAPLRLAVLPDTLRAGGRALPRPDSAVTELAAILHRHQVGELTIKPGTDAGLWRQFLALLARPPEESRASGGLGRAWTTGGDPRIEIRAVDYAEMLRARPRGDRATWDSILAGCLEGANFTVDQDVADALAAVVDDPDSIEAVIAVVESRLPEGEAEGRRPAIVAALLRAVARYVEATEPERAAEILDALAGALFRLPVPTLAPLVSVSRSTSQPGLGRFMEGLVDRVPDPSIASIVAGEVRAGRSLSPQLADLLRHLSPDAGRRAAILGLTQKLLQDGGGGGDSALARVWHQTEERFAAYWEAAGVSDAYKQELGRVFHRAVDLVRAQADPPEVVDAWCATVDEGRIRVLDASLLTGLMTLRNDLYAWREISALAVHRMSAFVVLGDFEAAAAVVENLRAQAATHPSPAVRDEAAELVNGLLTASTMRYIASHLDTTDPAVVAAARRFCVSLGTALVGPLAEALSVEDRERRRKNLADILLGFGPPGREVIDRLCQSPNPAVRRTAVLLLKESGARDVVPELVALLNDAEAHVQRDATRALAELGLETADDALVAAVAGGPERTRSCVLGALRSLAQEDAVRVWARILLKAPRRGGLWEVHGQAAERLGTFGGRPAVDALEAVLAARSFRAPFRMAALHRLVIENLARVGTPEAMSALESAAAYGSRWIRAAARATLVAARRERES
jgi:HEAT repeat protein